MDLDGCPFCQIATGEEDARIVYSAPDVMAFFPLWPAAVGHTLVVPRSHVSDIFALTADQMQPVMAAVQLVGNAVKSALTPDGMNIITSSGEAASQSVFHLHVHVVPRWANDRIGQIWPPAEAADEHMQDELLERLAGEVNRLDR